MDNISRFLKRKAVKEILGENYVLTNIQRTRLNKVFEYYGTPNNIHDWCKSIAIMIKNDLINYYGRIKRLKSRPSSPNNKSYILRYGIKEGRDKISQVKTSRTKHLKNTYTYWKDSGLSESEVKSQIKKLQTENGALAAKKLKGSKGKYSCRSMKYWIRNGYSEKEARDKVSSIQIANGKGYYLNKGYSIEDAVSIQEKRNTKWLSNLNNKSEEDISLMNLKKGHTIKSYLARGLSLDEATEKSNNFFKNNGISSNSSNEFFDLLSSNLNTNEVFYQGKNHEFQINGKTVDFYYPEYKMVVEYYGNYWHMNPSMYIESDMCHNKTAKEIWKHDETRIKLIEQSEHVDKVFIIWEKDTKDNPIHVINTIKDYINGKHN